MNEEEFHAALDAMDDIAEPTPPPSDFVLACRARMSRGWPPRPGPWHVMAKWTDVIALCGAAVWSATPGREVRKSLTQETDGKHCAKCERMLKEAQAAQP